MTCSSARSRRGPRGPGRGAAGNTALLLLFAAALGVSGCAPVPRGGAPAAALRLESIPAGAAIVLDGREIALRTPARIPSLAAGEHVVRLSLPGYRPHEETFTVAPGSPFMLKTRLVPVAIGAMTLRSTPEGCEVYLDGEKAPELSPVMFPELSVGTHTIQVSKEGYEDWSQAVVILGGRHFNVDAALVPLRRTTGHLQVQTHPPHAAILLDGYPTGKSSPATLYGIIAGRHRVELVREGYRRWSEEVTVSEGRTQDLLVTLKRQRLRQGGAARIETDPPGAAVIVDNVMLRDRTPLDIESMAAGNYPIELRREGYAPWTGTLSIQSGERTRLSETLRPRRRRTGELSLESIPPGAAVTVDGEALSRSTPARLDDLPAGNHTISLSLPGYRPWRRTVFVSPDRASSLQARLVAEETRLETVLVSAGEEEVEIEIRFPEGAPRPEEGRTLTLSTNPTSFGEFLPARLPAGEDPVRARLLIRSGLDEGRLVFTVGDIREERTLERRPLGWVILPPDEPE